VTATTGTTGTAGLVPLPELRPLLSGSTFDAADCATLFRALGEVPLQVAGTQVVAGTAERLAAAERALALQEDLREHVVDVRSAAFARIQQVLAEARARFSSAELLARSTELLCEACDLDRAVFSRVEGSCWVLGAAHVVNGPGLEPPADLRILLRGGLLEAEAVRRRQGLLVRDARAEARTDPGFLAWFAPTSYVAVPLIVADRVVGLLHADRAGGRRLTSMDRDLVAAFAHELARSYEHAALLESFAQQQCRIRAALAVVDDLVAEALEEPQTAVVRFARRTVRSVGATEVGTPALCCGPFDSLSEREREVLALMAQGATNRQVAARLVVSESTVKSHVKQILRKLCAGNRAEAVYLYLRDRESGDRAG
jgi:DNA-binding CsgD family transcriptional regulator